MLTNLSGCDFTPEAELSARIRSLQGKLAEQGVDYAVILQNVDLFYFTGSLQNAVLVVPQAGDPLFMVQKNIARARVESRLEVIPITRDKDVKDLLLDRGILKGRCGMELDVVPVLVYERWKSILGFDKAADVSGAIRDLRLIKSPYEQEQVRRSGGICAHVFEKAKETIREGMRELDIDGILASEGRRFGHQGFLRMRGLNQEMMTIYITHGRSSTIVSGADVPISGVGITHAIGQGASLNVVQRDVPLLIDYGGGYNGYITDETRVYVVGKLPYKFEHAYGAAREIIEDTASFAREGVNGTEVFERSRRIAKKAGLDDHFMGHGPTRVGFVGHGLGLEINELPVITPRHSIVLREGMVFAFEPKFVFPGEGAVGIEVDFIVHKDRLERVSDYPIDVIHL